MPKSKRVRGGGSYIRPGIPAQRRGGRVPQSNDRGASAEDDLLLQVQGVIAEYERAKILERGHRGRRHAGGGVARVEPCGDEARVVPSSSQCDRPAPGCSSPLRATPDRVRLPTGRGIGHLIASGMTVLAGGAAVSLTRCRRERLGLSDLRAERRLAGLPDRRGEGGGVRPCSA